MTPKEKAEDLVAKIHQFIPLADNTYPKERVEYKNFNAKECALIAADEVVKFIKPHDDIAEIGRGIFYWQQVKEEIEKL